MLRVALIGLGAIGSAAAVLLRDMPGVQLRTVVVSGAASTARMAEVQKRLVALVPEAVLTDAVPLEGIDLLVEAAGHGAIAEHVLPALRRGLPCIVASVGALSEPGLIEQLEEAACQGGTQLELIAGAIGAIDALAAAKVGGLSQVRYTGRKPPQAWMGTPVEQRVDLAALCEPQVVFEGTARQAAAQFPKNANVAATVSLAGLGLDATQVRLIVDPTVRDNVHTIEAEGSFGHFELSMRNLALASNPKTSAQTVYSLIRAIQNRVQPVII
ncbi:aspartate dehydrogenase [Vandammella animalimorsus]|uniref:L-aspartate dehydrogenase n=1 Tax=Vandammella animalimorsus TaxID=2029117 RepID=A0A2A2ABG8_9BURK|nr:aspartate dehydrogenase [Vandammella animalimorsus]PAT35088.1 aspartate dehydrogenase [Vandammella animalimorsus]